MTHSTTLKNTTMSKPRPLEKHASIGEPTQEMVILRRKWSVNQSEDRASGASSGQCSDRVSKVDSVSCDVMSGEPIRMMGYMEKRSKLMGWKKYWFVLDGHLLTYFKSKADYENLSPFVGSITLGNVSTVRPIQIKHCRGFPMQIVSRNQVYSLRCSEKPALEEWVLALQETISMPHSISSPVWADPGAQFYRYSFASASDWSIADSQGDISGSLSNLPKNFYLKRDKIELKQKCQSFANLPTELPDSPNASTRSNYSGMSGRQDPKMRYSASLIQLDSSTQASELKRELATKLSTGRVSPSSIRSGEKFREPITPKVSTVEDGEDPVPLAPNTEKLSVLTQTEPSRNTLGLSAIAEGLEPNLIRRPHTLQLPASGLTAGSQNVKKKRGISTMLQRLFKKELEQGSSSKNKERPMVISSPVDLRAQARVQSEVGPRCPSVSSASTTTRSSLEPLAPKLVQATASFLSELKTIQRDRRRSSEEEGSSSQTVQEPGPPPPLPKKSTSSDTSDTHPQCTDSDVASSECMTYDQKLAKFNRLSSQLHPSQSLAITSSIYRSSSCRVKNTQDDDDIPPILPPKKGTLTRDTNLPSGSAYDTPSNNRPVTGTPPDYSAVTFFPELAISVSHRERKISLKELLSKKNSAPEIILDVEALASQFKPTAEPVLTVDCTTSINEIEPKAETCKEPDAVYYSQVPLEEPTEAIYEEIKYATQEHSIKELETVQEYCDEDELYDEFVMPMSPCTVAEPSAGPSRQPSLRSSGILALQAYLNLEVLEDTGEAAVNRLGRSVAVHKLETLLDKD